MDIGRAVVPVDQLKAISENIHNNAMIRDYYEQMKHNLPDWIASPDIPLFKQVRLDQCNRFWISDYYQGSAVKDFQKTSLCEDKFCNNCKKVKQARRMATFKPEIEKYTGSLHLLTLTIPNITGDKLQGTIKKLQKSFTNLTMYLKCKTKAKGINMEQFHYRGAVRSLEVTFRDNIYHPHYHVILVADPDPDDANIKNAFSIDYRGIKQERLFTSQEVLIQKLWRTIYDGTRVNAESVMNLENGYSCTLDKLNEGDYLEVFKYMTKATDQDNRPLSYNQFLTLYKALDGIRQIQGYGCLYRLTDDDLISPEAIDEAYKDLIMQYQEREKPVKSWDTPQALSESQITVISRKRIGSALREIYQHPDDTMKRIGCQKGGEME